MILNVKWQARVSDTDIFRRANARTIAGSDSMVKAMLLACKTFALQR